MSKTTKLANGVEIPTIGFGTGTKWFKSEGPSQIDQKTVDAVLRSLDNGLLHIDTAEIYNTHLEVAEALKQYREKNPSYKRSDVFITDKFTPQNKSPLKVVNETLKEFETDYLDLYLVHTPFLRELSKDESLSLKTVWQEVEQLYEEGKVKAIGVSNFRVSDIEELLQFAKHKPVVNQIEFSLVLQHQSPDIVEYSQKHDIVVEAYSPLAPITKGTGPEYQKLNGKLNDLAKKYSKNTSQIALRWVVERGVVPITTSEKAERLRDSLAVLDFQLTSEEVDELTKLGAEAPQIRQYWGGFY